MLYRRLVSFGLSMMLVSSICSAASAQSVEEFYLNRQLTFVVAAGAGGGYGLYATLLSRYLGHHVPGSPSVVLKFMPGAGGRKAANYLYGAAPKDGSAIGMLLQNTALDPILQPAGAKFDAAKFSWIGSMSPMRAVAFVRREAPATTIAGLRKTQVVMGATGKAAPSFLVPTLMNNLLGTRIRIVPGYRGARDVYVAVERGEVDGWTGSTWDAIRATKPAWITERKIVPVLQLGLATDPALPEIPLLINLVKSERDKHAAELVLAASELGRIVLAPPGVPSDRLAALRRAFEATLADKAFLAEAKKRKAPIEVIRAPQIEALIHRMMSIPAAQVAHAKAVLGLNP